MKDSVMEKGFLLNNGIQYYPLIKNWRLSAGFQLFETDSYNSRLYSFEHDVRFSYSIPAYADKGMRYYFNINWRMRSAQGRFKFPDTELWLRWSRSIYKDKNAI